LAGGVVDLKLIGQGVQAEEINSGAKRALESAHLVGLRRVARRLRTREAPPKNGIYDFLERSAPLVGQSAQFGGDVVIKSERCSHIDIMMSKSYDVKMLFLPVRSYACDTPGSGPTGHRPVELTVL